MTGSPWSRAERFAVALLSLLAGALAFSSITIDGWQRWLLYGAAVLLLNLVAAWAWVVLRRRR